jgi:hypothetical protein
MGAIEKGYRIEVGPWRYEFVRFAGLLWRCSCRDWAFAAQNYQFSCAHISQVKALLASKEVA